MKAVTRFDVALARMFFITVFGLTSALSAQAQIVDPSNPDNPYDHFGQQHNEGLDHIIANKDRLGTRPQALLTNGARLAVEFGCSIVERVPASSSTSPGRSAGRRPKGCASCAGGDALLLAGRIHDISGMTQDEFLASRPLVGLQLEYLNIIFDVLNQLRTVDPTDPGSILTGTENVVLTLRAVEAEVMAAMPEDEAALVLQASSVARHSVVYWGTEMSRPASDWGSGPGSDPAPLLFINFDDIGKADFAGLINDGILGAVFASYAELMDQLGSFWF
ncbi:MAG: hypothetical protein AAF533_05565 [Acidobacteriota bacterium]